MKKLKSYLIKFIILPISDRVMKTKIAFYYKEIKRLEKLSKPEIINWQNNRIKSLINHAYNNCEYYNRLLNELNLKPSDFESAKDLEKLPILTKKTIRDNFDELTSKNIDKIPSKQSSTGGSTGDPAVFLVDNKSWSFTVANTIVNWEKNSGYQYGDKHIALGSTSLFVNKRMSIKHRIYYLLKGKIGLNGVNMSDEVCSNYIDFIRKEKIQFIYGYASSIYLLAKYVQKNKILISIKACYPTSEILLDVYRDTIASAFNCKILDGYGASDGGITAFEHSVGYYQVGYNCLISQRSIDKDFIGSILITDLLNFAMPLINYQLGDEIQIIPQKNINFSYNGQIINKVIGRISDVIELENGSVITGPGFTILFKDLPVEYYNIKKTGINSITCTIKKLEKFTDTHEEVIISTFKKQMGLDSSLCIIYSDEIVLSKNGKIQYFSN